ncbi:MAG TPA: adenylosuccinate synthetase [Candidatus Dormibacteraeota bacterium]|nr:adenylosuccinate synthetase [Candidatus Dormibacteraeota bacterium]
MGKRIISKVLFSLRSIPLGNPIALYRNRWGFLWGRRERRRKSSPRGKIAAYLALKDKPDICVRGGNGPNAGHTVFHDGKEYHLRLIPSGFVNRSTRLMIGPGVPVETAILVNEIKETESENRINVDYQCAILEERHKTQECESDHLSNKIGSTKSGVGACNAERALRMVKLARQETSLRPYVGDTVAEIHKALSSDRNVMVEGTQGTFLSLYHGTYPYVTSKDVTASQACADVGIGPTDVDDVMIIFKAYVTRVGEGPLEGQLDREEVLRRGWMEHGTVTGRERRAAPFDFKLAKRAVQLNGATQIALTKLDVLYPTAKGVRDYLNLPKEARDFAVSIERETNVPVTLIGTGPDEKDIIDKRPARHASRLRPTLVSQGR